MADTERFLVVHTLRVKGLASAEHLAEITGCPDLVPVLEELTAEGLVKLRTGRVGGYTLTKEGRAAHPDLVAAAVTEGERAGVARTYEAFIPVNGRFKEVCTRWQMRPGPDGAQQSNDHSDAAYDATVIEELGAVHEDAVRALAPAADASARFGRYVDRFTAALERVRAGEQAAFARPMSHSYHDVWMELHEDLLLTLGRVRDAADGH
ncbi:MarR family transcriptional regulator [Pseudonocardia kujensis]|uniref:MarR family transcriptional regulator n=1 Tax=Pseudonocardia kujensis TaxID=1128675 RepID=UPI001E28F5BB|nr:MarR family transcriptional regulator [Pseudonocardia kujensis]MCE0761958.1 MarR family transcriptional regulator [Pseudonocardia kujensis]